MTQTQKQELNNLVNRYRTIGLTGPELKRKAALESKRTAELDTHQTQLGSWAARFRVIV